MTVQHLLREHSVDDSFIDEAQYSHVAYTEWMDGLTYKALTLLPWPLYEDHVLEVSYYIY